MNNITAKTIQIILLLAIFYFAFTNTGSVLSIKYYYNADAIQLSATNFILFVYLLGLITGSLKVILAKNEYKNRMKFYEQKNEQLSQNNEINTDEKAALERKISALEIALKNAINNKE